MRHQTEADQIEQRKILTEVAASCPHHKFEITELPAFCRLDAMFSTNDGEVSHLVEVKGRRRKDARNFDTLWLPLDKFLAMVHAHRAFNCPNSKWGDTKCMMLWGFREGIYALSDVLALPEKITKKIVIAGADDDKEQMILIPKQITSLVVGPEWKEGL